MNTLSIILYLIDVLGNLQGLLAVSEASEMVIMNDEVRSVMDDVKDVLKAQLNKLKE